MTTELCPFCEIAAGRAPAKFVHACDRTIGIVPLGPVTDGHVLVIPRAHVPDFTTDTVVSAITMSCAAEIAERMGPVNLITSKGVEATQSVFHLHLHLVPRKKDDGLALPWYSGRSKAPGDRLARCETCDRVVPVVGIDFEHRVGANLVGSSERRIGPHLIDSGEEMCPGSGRKVGGDGRH